MQLQDNVNIVVIIYKLWHFRAEISGNQWLITLIR